MYKLWARSRETKQYILLMTFDDPRQFDYLIDQVDAALYEEALILYDENRVARYKEFGENRKLSL